MNGTVVVERTALPFVRKGGSAGSVLVFEVAPAAVSSPWELQDAATNAVAAANAAVLQGSIVGEVPTVTAKGIAVSVFGDAGDDAAIRHWLSTLAASFEARGLRGIIRAVNGRGPKLHDFFMSEGQNRYPAAFCGYRVHSYDIKTPMVGWQVDGDLCAEIAEGLGDWARLQPSGSNGWAYLMYGAFPIRTSQVSEFFAASARHSTAPRSVAFFDAEPTRHDQVAMDLLGTLVSQSAEPGRHWRDLVDHQIALLLAAPGALDVGMVKNCPTGSTQLESVSINVGEHAHPTARRPLDYLFNRHLWSKYVIDAAGVSLLTSQHLAHAHDLSDWDITEVAPERFLVKARDLAAWFEPIVPDDAVIEKARADFGDAILSWDAILADPGPLTQTEPGIVGR